jgi:thiamine biosynthesis lipoprotein ApbE
MQHRPTDRDRGLRRVSRLTRWLTAGAAAAVGVLSALVAQAVPGSSGRAGAHHYHHDDGRPQRPRPEPAAGAGPRADPPPPRRDLWRHMTDPWASEAFRALGTTAVLAVTERRAQAIARARLDHVLAEVDRACSRFRPDSELIAVNEGAGRPVPVGPVLLDALDVALRAARLTDGDVDPTVGRSLRVLGYDRDFAAVAATGDALTCVVERVPGWRSIVIDRDEGTAQVPSGVELDLGATAKAFAVDWAASTIGDEVEGGVLVSLGGDIAVGGDAPPGGWPVRVADDHAAPEDADAETVAITTGGLATSSTTVRRWQRGDDDLHHIIDPESGQPAPSCWRTVSVVAQSCVDANIASTAAIVRGEPAARWLAGLGLAARLVRVDGTVVRVAGWPAADAA